MDNEDIIIEILSRVTRVESLVRLRCVSKSLRCLIDSKFFINGHLHHATRSTATLGNILVLYTIATAKPAMSNSCVLGCYLDKPTSVSRKMIDPQNSSIHRIFIDLQHSHLLEGYIAGHCNGLLLVVTAQQQAFLWNPSMGVSIQLPDLGYNRITKCGVGWDQQSDTYKVLVMGLCNGDYMVNAYSMKEKSWSKIKDGCECISYHMAGAYGGGRIHWLVRRGGRVCMEWWEVRSGVFGWIELPREFKLGNYRVRVWLWLWLWERAGCIHLVYDAHDFTARTVWALEGNKNTWLELPNSPLPSTVRAHQAGAAFSIIPTLVKP